VRRRVPPPLPHTAPAAAMYWAAAVVVSYGEEEEPRRGWADAAIDPAAPQTELERLLAPHSTASSGQCRAAKEEDSEACAEEGGSTGAWVTHITGCGKKSARAKWGKGVQTFAGNKGPRAGRCHAGACRGEGVVMFLMNLEVHYHETFPPI
jgi:hypothetical protein